VGHRPALRSPPAGFARKGKKIAAHLLECNENENGSRESSPAKALSSVINEFKFKTEQEIAWNRALDSAKTGIFVLSWGVPNGTTETCRAWVEAPFVGNLKLHYELLYEHADKSRVQVWQRSDGS